MEKEFEVKKLTNGRGNEHLVAILDQAITDIKIGSVIIIPYADGFKDPTKVLLQCDENGNPKRANKQFAIVLEYIYD